MQVPGRELGKLERQRLIGSLITRKQIGTQLELLQALAGAGCSVTQATISRDIRELGIEKGSDLLGRPRYVLPQRSGRASPQDALAAMLGQFGRRAAAAQNIVVLVSELGTAPAIARTLDRVQHPKVVGTLAGDDTTLVVTRTTADARTLARELAGLIGT